MPRTILDRCAFLRSGVLGATGLALGGCEIFDGATEQGSTMGTVFESGGGLTYRAQRLLGGGHSLARENTRADILQSQHPNGSVSPDGEEYLALARKASHRSAAPTLSRTTKSERLNALLDRDEVLSCGDWRGHEGLIMPGDVLCLVP